MKLDRYMLRLASLILFCCAGVNISIAQERPTWGPAVSFPNGTFIQTGIGTVPVGELGVTVNNTSVVTTVWVTPDRGVFRRILRLSDGRAIIYEMAVKRLEEGKHFEVAITPWIPTLEEARDLEIDPAKVERSFLSSYSAPFTINDGDMIALDVLINPRSGVKLVDYFRVTSRVPVPHSSLKTLVGLARKIEIGDVEFSVRNFELRLNGKSIYTSKGGMSGRYIWLDVPQTGRFIFSLTPMSEADGFYRTAYLTRQQIVFGNESEKYELISEHRIIPASGVFYLWVRLDPSFTFPAPAARQFGNDFSIGAADNLPLAKRKE